MDTELYIKILIVQANFLHCFFACFTLFFLASVKEGTYGIVNGIVNGLPIMV